MWAKVKHWIFPHPPPPCTDKTRGKQFSRFCLKRQLFDLGNLQGGKGGEGKGSTELDLSRCLDCAMERKYFIAKTYYAIFFIHYVWELTDICLTTEFRKMFFFYIFLLQNVLCKVFLLNLSNIFHIGITCISINFATL